MARKVRHSALESRSARLKLRARRRPYSGPSLARGVSLLYRRNATNGTWVLKASDGHGAYWTKAFAEADDFDESNGKNVLTFFEAQDVAKKLARGEDGSADSAPTTIDTALKAYKADLIARSANPYNAEHPRLHLSSALLAKPVALLASKELKAWRDSLIGTMKPSTINRLCRCICAALTLAAQHDDRIKNSDAWETGLAGLPDAQEARNVILSDEKVREFVAAAYDIDHQFGLLIDLLAVTGGKAEPGRAAAPRGPKRPSAAAETDDAEIRKGRRTQSRAKAVPALQRADHCAIVIRAEGGSEGPRRRCTLAAAKRRTRVG
ncbi:hypothetical protein ABIF61_003134 [Bradyrhizobium japonicum]|uniref:hypothetical protein n=1 Tax=Bradyrhizobium ottawaense TaxID=931866 RepID=UPI00349BA3DA